jgi:hypothetical protein
MLASALCLWQTVSVFADITLSAAADIAIRGRWADEKTQSITVNGHGFYLRPDTITRTAAGVQAEDYLRHRIVGKGDRVHIKLLAEEGKPPYGIITKIEYRGVRQNWLVKIFPKVPGAVGEFQRWRVGSWEASAQQVVDEMANRLAREL